MLSGNSVVLGLVTFKGVVVVVIRQLRQNLLAFLTSTEALGKKFFKISELGGNLGRESLIHSFGYVMTRILYFPTIEVPQNSWLRQSLLYWDGISSMVPEEFWLEPERLGDDMRQLVLDGIIQQEAIYPNISKMSGFEKNFIDHLERTKPRRQEGNYRFNIHLEKLGQGELGEYLVRNDLAETTGGPWMRTDADVANDFMPYLATCIANRTKNKFVASTDDAGSFARLSHDEFSRIRFTQSAIERLLPYPNKKVDFRDIVEFRDENKKLLDSLRREVRLRIDRNLLLDSETVSERIDIEIEDLRERSEQLASKMGKRKWGRVGFGGFTGLGASILGSEPLLDSVVNATDGAVALGLASAIATTLSGLKKENPRGYTAYTALAHAQFG